MTRNKIPIDTSHPKTRAHLHAKYGGRCAYCGCQIEMKDMQVDHVIPINRGFSGAGVGLRNVDNYNPSCATCNSSKSNKSVEEFRAHLAFRIEYARKESASLRLLEKYNLVKVTHTPVVFFFERKKTGAQ